MPCPPGLDAKHNGVVPHLIRAGADASGGDAGGVCPGRELEGHLHRHILELAHANQGHWAKRAGIAPSDWERRDHLLHHQVGGADRLVVDLKRTDLIRKVMGLLRVCVPDVVRLVTQIR